MQTKRVVQIASLAALGAILAGTGIRAGRQEPAARAPSTWSQTVTKEQGVEGQEFDAKQLDIIQKVNAYFNQMGEMKGAFVQTSARQQAPARQVLLQAPGPFPLRIQPAEPAADHLGRQVHGHPGP